MIDGSDFKELDRCAMQRKDGAAGEVFGKILADQEPHKLFLHVSNRAEARWNVAESAATLRTISHIIDMFPKENKA